MSLANRAVPAGDVRPAEPFTPSGAYLAAPVHLGGTPGGDGQAPPTPPGDGDERRTRSFACREALWQSFQSLAGELDCSVDFLINDALKQYLRQRTRISLATPIPVPEGTHARVPMPPSAPPLPPPLPQAPRALVSTQRMDAVEPLPHAPPAAMPPQRPALPTLRVHHQGRVHLVHKTRFVIGRGKRGVDLLIDDPNISRQHALIELVGGYFWLTDLGSTNGIERGGARVSRVVIAEGDVFDLCGHALWFSYR